MHFFLFLFISPFLYSASSSFFLSMLPCKFSRLKTMNEYLILSYFCYPFSLPPSLIPSFLSRSELESNPVCVLILSVIHDDLEVGQLCGVRSLASYKTHCHTLIFPSNSCCYVTTLVFCFFFFHLTVVTWKRHVSCSLSAHLLPNRMWSSNSTRAHYKKCDCTERGEGLLSPDASICLTSRCVRWTF